MSIRVGMLLAIVTLVGYSAGCSDDDHHRHDRVVVEDHHPREHVVVREQERPVVIERR